MYVTKVKLLARNKSRYPTMDAVMLGRWILNVSGGTSLFSAFAGAISRCGLARKRWRLRSWKSKLRRQTRRGLTRCGRGDIIARACENRRRLVEAGHSRSMGSCPSFARMGALVALGLPACPCFCFKQSEACSHWERNAWRLRRHPDPLAGSQNNV